MPCPSMGAKWFWTIQIILVEYGSNSFWSDPNHIGQVQIIKNSPEKSNLNLTKIIWTQPKRFGPKAGTRPEQFGRSKIILHL